MPQVPEFSRFLLLGPNLQKNLKICPKIVLRRVIGLSYDIDLRSAKIILRFSQVNLRKRSEQILNFAISFVVVYILRH